MSTQVIELEGFEIELASVLYCDRGGDHGELVELSAEVVLATEQFVKMRDAIVAFLSETNSGTASELRELLGTSRRVIIPFLERLDRDGVTRRIADKRVLAKPS